jgi:hypothetical protein
MYEQLVKFRQEHSHTEVPRRNNETTGKMKDRTSFLPNGESHGRNRF